MRRSPGLAASKQPIIVSPSSAPNSARKSKIAGDSTDTPKAVVNNTTPALFSPKSRGSCPAQSYTATPAPSCDQYLPGKPLKQRARTNFLCRNTCAISPRAHSPETVVSSRKNISFPQSPLHSPPTGDRFSEAFQPTPVNSSKGSVQPSRGFVPPCTQRAAARKHQFFFEDISSDSEAESTGGSIDDLTQSTEISSSAGLKTSKNRNSSQRVVPMSAESSTNNSDSLEGESSNLANQGDSESHSNTTQLEEMITSAFTSRVRAVVWDFDHTILRIHAFAMRLTPHMVADRDLNADFTDLDTFRKLVPQLIKAGIWVGIASFGRRDVIRTYLDRALGPDMIDSTAICTPNDLNISGITDGCSVPGRKLPQLGLLATRWNIPKEQIAFFDDDLLNIHGSEGAISGGFPWSFHTPNGFSLDVWHDAVRVVQSGVKPTPMTNEQAEEEYAARVAAKYAKKDSAAALEETRLRCHKNFVRENAHLGYGQSIQLKAPPVRSHHRNKTTPGNLGLKTST